MASRRLAFLVIGLLASCAAGLSLPPSGLQIRYAVQPVPAGAGDTPRLQVALHLSGFGGSESVRLQMPVWSPGDYHVQNHGRYVREESAESGGKDAGWRRIDANTWEVATAGADRVVFRYSIPNVPPGFFTENVRVTPRYAFWNGPAAYMYVVGHKQKPVTLEVNLPGDWKEVVTPLDPAPARSTFSAADYDTLADSPVVCGDVETREFEAGGRRHVIAFFNQHSGMRFDDFAPVLKPIVEEQQRMMGGAPYSRYVFFLDVNGPGGGLEHLQSSRMSWRKGFPARGIAGFAAHEFFHLWNVKRIRPEVLGPFDYINPPKTRNLWFAEGVTSYYGDLSVLRAGLTTEAAYLGSVARSMAGLRANPARRRVTADESSLRVWEANNSSGYGGLSYYDKGELIGLCLDLKLRGITGNRSSLDGVMRDLLDRYGLPKPGYPEDGIREAVVRAGGAEMGPFYDLLARSTEEMPYGECLRYAGLSLEESPSGFAIRSDPAASPPQLALRRSWLSGR